MSRASIPFVWHFGPRRLLLFHCLAFLSIALGWCLCPPHGNPIFTGVIFFLNGGFNTGMDNSGTHYFLQTAKVQEQVIASIVIAVASSLFGAFLASRLAGSLLPPGKNLRHGQDCPFRHQCHFQAVLLLMPPAFLLRLTPLPRRKTCHAPLLAFLPASVNL